jgi:uncharacterized membrane-anchored protein
VHPAERLSGAAAKVPAITLGFWITKILATTLGETGGDATSLSLGLGYALSSAILLALFVVAAERQIESTGYRPYLFWATIAVTTMAGTTLSDFTTKYLALGYAGGVAIFAAVFLGLLIAWFVSDGSVSATRFRSKRTELYYWLVVLTSQTMGTALGDWLATSHGLGYLRGSLLFASGLVVAAVLYSYTAVSRQVLFWFTFALTRPLGATLGDLIDKPFADGGMAIDRFNASIVLAIGLFGCVTLLSQRAADAPTDLIVNSKLGT